MRRGCGARKAREGAKRGKGGGCEEKGKLVHEKTAAQFFHERKRQIFWAFHSRGRKKRGYKKERRIEEENWEKKLDQGVRPGSVAARRLDPSCTRSLNNPKKEKRAVRDGKEDQGQLIGVLERRGL